MLHALRQQGLSYREIARRTRYERRSITKWLKFKAPPDRRRAALTPHHHVILKPLPNAGGMGTGVDGIYFMTSSSAATSAAPLIWSGC